MTDHGGSLERARARFPNAPQPWIDLSTGINPHAYPQLAPSKEAFTRLPEPRLVAELCAVAAGNYGAPSGAHVAAAPGTQILLPMVARLVAPGRALVLGPTYAEHIRAVAIAVHKGSYVSNFNALFDADLAIVVNPNNPDGRIIEREKLLELATHLRRKGGLLVVDEAFMDVGPITESVAADVEDAGAVVLKSFGKFFGLAGIRLGFALAAGEVAQRLRDELGPWAVSGPALEQGLTGLSDAAWQEAMRARLRSEATVLDNLLRAAGLSVVGGTSLFRFVRTDHAEMAFNVLGQAGILVRRFDALPDALRFGLPGEDTEWARLEAALGSFANAVKRDRLVSAAE